MVYLYNERILCALLRAIGDPTPEGPRATPLQPELMANFYDVFRIKIIRGSYKKEKAMHYGAQIPWSTGKLYSISRIFQNLPFRKAWGKTS